MSRIIKEPFEQPRGHLVFGNVGEWTGDWWPGLQKRVVALSKLANTSRDDVCMIVLLVSLLVTTLLLPWIAL
jgi:hypothetical protein